MAEEETPILLQPTISRFRVSAAYHKSRITTVPADFSAADQRLRRKSSTYLDQYIASRRTARDNKAQGGFFHDASRAEELSRNYSGCRSGL